jgi:transposase
MANRLTMVLADTIKSLHRQGWSRRRIARELNLDRETVGRYVQQAQDNSKPARAPTGSDGAADNSKPARAPTGSDNSANDPKPAKASLGSEATADHWTPVSSELLFAAEPQPLESADASKPAKAPLGSDHAAEPPRQEPACPSRQASACEAFRQVIVDKLDAGLSAQRIYQDLINDHAFAGSYYSVRRFVRRLGAARPLPFRRLECGPGEEAQVDFGSGAPLLGSDGKRRRCHCFRIVLSHSRKAYSEVVLRQSTENFIRCLENAFWYFGGTPQRLVLDNLRAAVSRADWYDPELNPKIEAFAAHYGIVVLPTKPYTPRHKGKVEAGVDYVQENALKGRTFASVSDENTYLHHWEATVADTRIHGTTRQQVGKAFATVERPALRPLPAERFPFFHEAQRSVHRDGHIEVDRAYYSVPAEYVGRRLWARWDGRLVRVFNERFTQIAVHVKQERGRFSTQRQHIVTEKINAVERGAEWLLRRVRLLGESCSRWAQAMLQERGVEGVRVLQGLLALGNKYSSVQLQRACDIAHSHVAYRLRTVRTLLKRDEQHRQDAFEFASADPIIRPLAEYDQLVRDSIHTAFDRKETDH